MISFIRDIFHLPYFIAMLAIISSVCYYYIKSDKSDYKKLIWAVHSSLFFVTASIFIFSAFNRINNPQVWDFTCYFLWGKVAALGYNFYLPENSQIVLKTLDIPFQSSDLGGFMTEVVNVGFAYPPPTIFYFLPLGYFSYKTALTLWTLFNLIIVSGCLLLIYDQFFRKAKLNGVLLLGTLFFILGPCLSTISFSQTNFILLFLLLLMKKFENNPVNGLFLALAFFTKPYMIIFGLFYLFRSKWKSILYCAVSAVGIIGMTLLVFGKEPIISYIVDNPSHRFPSLMFHEAINQSLHAVLLRNGIISLDSPLVFIIIASGVLILTLVYLFVLIKKRLYDHIWVVLLLVGLLLYPGTLYYYGTLLLFIIFQFFDEKKPLGFKQSLNIPIIGIFFFLSTISVFSTILFLLGIIVIQSLISQSHKISAVQNTVTS
jgi:hypothetical protein